MLVRSRLLLLHLHETRLDKSHCVFSDKINRQIVGIVGTDSGFVMRANQPASEMSPSIENGRALMELSSSSSALPWRDLYNLYSHFQCRIFFYLESQLSFWWLDVLTYLVRSGNRWRYARTTKVVVVPPLYSICLCEITLARVRGWM